MSANARSCQDPTVDREGIIRGLRVAPDAELFEGLAARLWLVQKVAALLPSSEAANLSPQQRALSVVGRTIRHAHGVMSYDTASGFGFQVTFWRHVTEGGQRWDFEVDVSVDREGRPDIVDARVYRPEEIDARGRAFERGDGSLRLAAVAPFGMVACPCCGLATLEQRASDEICPVCHWQDDGQDGEQADEFFGGPNRVTLTDARRNFIAFGASDERHRARVRQPTAEEVRLRWFSDDGREIKAR